LLSDWIKIEVIDFGWLGQNNLDSDWTEYEEMCSDWTEFSSVEEFQYFDFSGSIMYGRDEKSALERRIEFLFRSTGLKMQIYQFINFNILDISWNFKSVVK